MTDLIAAEWLKLRTTRVLANLILAAVALSLGSLAGVILAADASALGTAVTVRRAFAATGGGAVLVLVLGIIVSAGEYRHRTAADTFLSTPRRHLVFAAKLVVGGGIGVAAGAATAAACLGLAASLYAANGVAFPIRSGEVWLTLSGVVVYIGLFALCGVALGDLLRSQTAAIAGALAWFGVVEHTLITLVPGLGRWLPLAAGEAVVRAPLDGLLSPARGAAVLGAYTVAIALASIRLTATRDV